MMKNLSLGLLSVPSLLEAPFVFATNRKTYRRFHDAPSTTASSGSRSRSSPSVQSLPWAHVLGGPTTDVPVSEQKLTLPVAIGAIISPLLIISVLVTIIPVQNPLMPFGISLICSIALLAALCGCIFWHRLKRATPDSATDILSELFPLAAILELGRVHFVCLGCQCGDKYRILVAAQNLYDQSTRLSASFGNCGKAPALSVDISGSKAMIAVNDFAIAESELSACQQAIVSVASEGSGGNKVRFGLRRAFRGHSKSTALSVAMAAAGHGEIKVSSARLQPGWYFTNADGKLPAPLQQHGTSAARKLSTAWFIGQLWEPAKPRSSEEAARLLLAAMRYGPQGAPRTSPVV